MTSVTHILDDGALGGVTRFLDALQIRLGPTVQQSRCVVTPKWSLPAAVESDVLVIHFTMSWSKLPYLLALRARRRNRPVVLVEHSYSAAFENVHVASPRRFRTMLRLAYAMVDRVVAVSYGQAAWMRHARLLPAAKLSVIRPFTDCEALSTLPVPVAHTGPLRLGAYGRYCSQKGFATLIGAMQKIDPSVATLTMRGFGTDAGALRSLAAPLPHVTIGEKVDDLTAFLACVDAVVVPSSFEPFGQVALEARLAARPLIVTNVDGLPEQVEPSTGLIVPPSNPSAMATAINELATAWTGNSWAASCHAARSSAIDHTETSTRRWQKLLFDLKMEREPSITGIKPTPSPAVMA